MYQKSILYYFAKYIILLCQVYYITLPSILYYFAKYIILPCQVYYITLTLTDFTLHFSCCFTKILHSQLNPLLNNFTMQEKCY